MTGTPRNEPPLKKTHPRKSGYTIDYERRDMDPSIFLTAAGGLLFQAGDSAIISDWLSMDEPDAITAIRAQVDSSPAADLERLDATLLTLASTHFDPAVRVQLVKFYAMFKIVELLRFEKFRGFPADIDRTFLAFERN